MNEKAQNISQREVIAFLQNPESYPAKPDTVDIHETHGAMVFLAGDMAYKIKKAIKFPYMDFSTLAKRRHFCEREIAINQPTAPEIYLGLVTITKEADGCLMLDGSGQIVEWAVKMRRFDQEMMLDQLPHDKVTEKALIERLAKAVFDYHQHAPAERASDGPGRIQLLIDELKDSFRKSPEIFPKGEATQFASMAEEHLSHAHYCLRLRGRRGFIRRCHGDLHLRNIVLMDEKPVLFDALEFDEELATIDTLYDLAFLLMDLDQRHMSPSANQLLNRYLYLSRALEDIYGMKAMPLFLAIRAGIRAMVANDHAQQLSGGVADEERTTAKEYFSTAMQYLSPKKPALVAIGGFSGTGKTTLASLLAGTLEQAPGFLHFRTDLERKALFNVPETERLAPSSYTQEVSDQVYAKLLRKARIGLKARQRIIVDAVFSKEREREDFESLAKELGVPFIGIWLEADEKVISARVEARKGDASDATPAVVHQQIERGVSGLTWHRINAGGTAADSLRQVLNIPEISDID
ncbi:bifunctional aminoglycoside phosphotransferase/ATP-binding protein [Sneathiella sp.]|uniref:bifunctional aminoglycoside phosphotransferase/ATP-binding protein n=1 Tax=Sneathiella sp. TaxID=1964365 RepID=UPI002633B53B|nr:bifunctional aminoglycoside phosphotransferase/ATP-binding protein [Sneathiella sp.]MDF2366207.1 AAA family ATPase [Sneathiella sp.]